jgi:hypothetical protein
MSIPQQASPLPGLLDALQRSLPGSLEKALKQELENLPAGTLPLEKGTSRGGFVDDSDISVTVIKVEQNENGIQAKVGVFFTEIIVGCGCGDDPMPENAYCEMLISIDRRTATARFEVVQP